MDIIDLTGAVTSTDKYIDVIDLTQNLKTATILSPERLADFRNSINLVFEIKKIKSSMSLLRLIRLFKRILPKNVEKFSKAEIDSALLQMDDANEIMVADGIVHLIC